MKKLLFVISNLNIGGPQKSLIALLDNIDYTLFEIDVLIIQPHGKLEEYINKNAKIIVPSDLVISFTLPSNMILLSLLRILLQCGIQVWASSISELIKGVLKYKSFNQSRQHFWSAHHNCIPKLADSYDAAFGILGMSTYYIVDCVNAKQNYYWIRNDTRILNRDKDIDAKYFRKCTGFLSVSHDCAKIFGKIYPFSVNKTRVFYNCIPEKFYASLSADTSKMQNCCAKYKLLTICRLDPLKGLEMAIEACKILRDDGFDICWFVLGDGGYRNKLERMIQNNGIKESFVLLGFHYNTLAFIKEADIVVHPSRTEGKSNAVDEALFCCKPTIVTNYATASEVIKHDINGVICQMSGISVAEAIKKVILNTSYKNSLIDECKRMNLHRSTADVNETLLQLLSN